MTRDEQIIALRTEGVTMREIGKRLGVTKAVCCSVIHRKAPDLKDPSRFRGAEPRTLYQRCDALHAQMDAVLAATKDVPGLRIKGTGYQVPTMTWAFPRSLTRGMAHGN